MDDNDLDPRLAADTLALGESELNRVLLARDARWPWILLVPRRSNVFELHDLTETDLGTLFGEVAIASEVMKRETGCEKVNVAAIGNIVRQLHVHIVARDQADPAWPGTIWGHGTAVHRAEEALPTFALAVQRRLVN